MGYHVTGFFIASGAMAINIVLPVGFDCLWPLLLTWFNFNPSMDK